MVDEWEQIWMEPAGAFGVALRLYQWGAVPDTGEGHGRDIGSQKCCCFLGTFRDHDREGSGLTEHPRPEGVGLVQQPEDTALLIERMLVFDRLAFIIDAGVVGFETTPGGLGQPAVIGDQR